MIPTFVNYNVNIQAIRYSKFQIDEVIKNAKRFSKFYNKGLLKNNNKNFEKKINFDGHAEIKISNLTFSYNKQNYIFKDLNLTISKGKTICISGDNGSGKSTLVDLIWDA